MTTRTASRLAWSIAVLSIVLSGGGLVFTIKNGSALVDYNGAIAVVVSVVFGLLGALLASRRPGNPIGWLFVSVAAIFALNMLADGVAEYTLVTRPGSVPGGRIGAWLATWSWTPASGLLLVFVLLLFPDGRLPSRRWRPVAWAGATGMALASVPAAITGWPLRGPKLRYPVDPPPSLPHAFRLAISIQQIAIVLIFACGLLSAVSLVVRFRRAQGEVRQQLRWFAFGGTIMVLALFASTPILTGSPAVAIVAMPMVPIATTVAILKYRLYDIDVVINKTLVYGSLAGFITAVYVGIVVGLGALIGAGTSKPNLGLSILATAVVAVAFQPVRERVQKVANRLVYGQRATPYEVLSEFGRRMAGTYAAEDVLPRMARILAEGTGAKEARVWLATSGALTPAASWPIDGANGSSARPDRADLLVPVSHQGEELGALSITKSAGDRVTPAEEKLTVDLASQAGLVLRNVKLIEDLKASRVRLVQAQDEERRKIERNIHDGAQQQLVALNVKLGLARRLSADPNQLDPILTQLQEETNQALQDLRDLARGIYPPLLADQGLTAALEAQARKSAVPVSVEANGIGRYPQDAEAAVYFCVLEALQNVAKYAGASRATVNLAVADGQLSFAVRDDGSGFDSSTTSHGTGLQGMADRLSALGGSIEVRSQPGRGTAVSGRVPVPALESVG